MTRLQPPANGPDGATAELPTRAADALRILARDGEVRRVVRESPALMRILGAASRRFVVGRDRFSALTVARRLRATGIASSLEFMGEDTLARDEVELATREFEALAAECAAQDVRGSVSLNLSHIGLALDPELAQANCERVLRSAASSETEVILNMEGSSYRPGILQVYSTLAAHFPFLGITLQVCVETTEEDVANCLRLPGRIRLVKGAYDELGAGRNLRSESVHARYQTLAEALLRSGHACAIATHDRVILEHLARLALERRGRVEIEMLYGVTPELLRSFRDRGVSVRTYLPYGEEWLLYFCHRLAEHPPNVSGAVAEVVPEFAAWVHQQP